MASPAVMRQATPQATPQAVMAHVRRLSDADPDFRFMSLNDLLQLLASSKPDFLLHEYNIAARAVDSIIKTLDDQNSEVQNLAIKWLVSESAIGPACFSATSAGLALACS